MAVGAADILAAVARRRDDLVELTCELVREQSTLGNEEGAQRIVAARLEAAGFSVARVEPNAGEALADPRAGYPSLPYDGRSSVIGTLPGSGGGRSLHLSGHVDVVPIDAPGDWTYEPWGGTVADGRIWGRGAGDMKGGLAAYVIAAEALAETHGDRRGDLLFSSVFEEECGGNGMWSITRAGHVADATLLGEPTGLKLSHGGTGVVWARLAARGAAGHAFLGRRSGSFDLLSQAVAALRKVEEEANTPPRDPVFAAVSDWPFSMSVGRIAGGVWTASLPAELVAYVRFGFGRDTSPQEMQDRIRAAVGEAAPEVDVTFEAFRAHAYCHETTGPFPEAVAAAHTQVTETPAEFTVFTATTDARYVEGPCLCYGAVAGNFHGADEWVDIASLEQTAAVVALAAADWLR